MEIDLSKYKGVPDLALPKQRSLWQDAWHRLISSTARLGMLWLFLFYQPCFSSGNIFGTDLDCTLLRLPTFATENSFHHFSGRQIGRDISRTVHGLEFPACWHCSRWNIAHHGPYWAIFSFYEMSDHSAERILLMGLVGFALSAFPAG
jgi:hypothetical protein